MSGKNPPDAPPPAWTPSGRPQGNAPRQARAGLGMRQPPPQPQVPPQGPPPRPVRPQGPLPLQPQPQVAPIMAANAIPPNAAQWTAEMLRVLGWNSKRVKQGELNTQNGALLQGQLNNPSPIMADIRGKHTALANAFATNGVWNSAQEMQAAEIRATLAFETMPNQKPELQTGSANPTFWVKGARDPLTNEDREFIFKPATPNSLMAGVPPGGEPIREALAGRAAEQLAAFTGLDFKMPLTNVISVDSTRLDAYNPEDSTAVLPKTPTQVGSLQQFSPSQGELRSHLLGAQQAITAQSCQNIAILDTVMLNLDRHDGNLLLDQAGTGVVPIDHGLSFPDFGAVAKGLLGGNMAGDKNVVLRMAKSYDAFSQASLDGIADIDPDLMQAALSAESAKMGQLQPSLEGKMSSEALTVSNLATQFLKAAAPSLPPAVLQAALGANAAELLDPKMSPQNRALATTRIIAEYQPKIAKIKEFWTMPGDAREALYKRLEDDRLLPPDDQQKWLYDNIDIVMEYSRGRRAKPAVAPARPPETADAALAKEQIALAFPKMKLGKKEGDWLPAWNRILKLGRFGEFMKGLEAQDPPLKLKDLGEAEAWFKRYMAATRVKERDARLDMIARAFPQLVMPAAKDGMPLSAGDQDKLLDAWAAIGRLGGMIEVRRKVTGPPPKPAPRDPQGALLLMLAQPPNAATEALQGLDYLDALVQLDNAIVSNPNQAAIAQLRANVTSGQVQGDPVAAVKQLTDTVVTAAVALVAPRYTALKYRLPEKEWGWAQLYLNNAYSGQIQEPVEYLHDIEQKASATPVRT
jgi:hypothetical protein